MLSFWSVIFIAIVLGGIIGAVVFGMHYGDDIEIGVINGIAVSALMLLILFIVFFPEKSSKIEHEKFYSEIQVIKSIEDNSIEHMNGEYNRSLFFAYGKITSDKDLYYRTMVGDDENGYLVKDFDASSTYLFSDGNTSPYLEYKYRDYIYSNNWWYGGIMEYDVVHTELLKTELHLPEDAIEIKYEIDLK